MKDHVCRYCGKCFHLKISKTIHKKLNICFKVTQKFQRTGICYEQYATSSLPDQMNPQANPTMYGSALKDRKNNNTH